jgi:hypothetical protein
MAVNFVYESVNLDIYYVINYTQSVWADISVNI